MGGVFHSGPEREHRKLPAPNDLITRLLKIMDEVLQYSMIQAVLQKHILHRVLSS